MGVGIHMQIAYSGMGMEGPMSSAGKEVRIPKVKMAEKHCLVKSFIMSLTQERNPLVIQVSITKHVNL